MTVVSSAGGPESVSCVTTIRHDLNPFRPALDAFPRAVWLSALSRVLRSVPDERLGYPDPAGAPELRATLAAYLGRVRGVRATPGQIVVTGGLRQGVELLWTVLADDGARRIALEQPGWRGMSETASDAGLLTVPVPVDEHGMVVERLEREQVDAVALAPAHQYPTGAVLAPDRRLEILAWARAHDALIVEDDYDAEYRYDRQPIGSLQGLEPERVAYGGSTSKTLAPVVRLGWLVLPPRLVEKVAERQRRRGSMPSPLHQLALADLIERGELDRHLRRLRRRYSRRRDALLDALARKLPEARVSGAAAGLYVLVGLPEGVSEQAVLAAARSRAVALEGAEGSSPALVVGYANLPDAAVCQAVDLLAASIREARTGGSLDRPVTGPS
jgi:GntR family transcriptional regulator/MocR family aminotransferase